MAKVELSQVLKQLLNHKGGQLPMPEPIISHVSDTARWIAAYRAMETRRPDALFCDPLAQRLAGEQGWTIVAHAPWFMRGGGAFIARTRLIDNLIVQSITAGADTVLNLAAGFDTRPYRMNLPPSLVWIEADLPEIINEKEQLLAGEKPVCRLIREKVNLSNQAALAAFLARGMTAGSTVLVVAEGLLLYLDTDTVQMLARELATPPAVRWWILNLSSPAALRTVERGFGAALARTPLKFAPPDGVAFFEKLGWTVRDVISLTHATIRFKRGPLWLRLLTSLLPESDPRNPKGRWGAVVRLERQ